MISNLEEPSDMMPEELAYVNVVTITSIQHVMNQIDVKLQRPLTKFNLDFLFQLNRILTNEDSALAKYKDFYIHITADNVHLKHSSSTDFILVTF